MITIPASPEFLVSGAKKHLTVRVLECTRGGFIVIYESHGMAACSTWGEVLDNVADTGGSVMDWDLPPPPPKVAQQWHDERPRRPEPKEPLRLTDMLHSIWIGLAAVGSALMAFVSVKTT